MRRNKIILVAASVLLVSCNGFKTIDEATAIQRAADILAHQKAEGFAVPDCFTINFHNYSVHEDCDKEGVVTTFTDLTQDFVFNYNKLACYEHDVSISVSDTGTGVVTNDKDVYRFYDKEKGMFYDVFTLNGIKELHETKMTEEQAKAKLESRRKARSAVLKFQQVLSGFKTIVDNINKMKEKFKDSTEEFAKISYASKNDKSLKVDYGYKEKDSITVEEVGECKGFHSYSEMAAYDNDLLLDRTMTESFVYSTDDKSFTTSLDLSNYIKIDQTKGDIKLPNPDDYRN